MSQNTSKLCLHIGHHKTGSTYLQGLLHRNRAVFARAGLIYPHDPSDPSNGKITSGNGQDLPIGSSNLTEYLKCDQIGNLDLVYSSEFLFDRLTALKGEDDLKILMRDARAAGFTQISILLFIRNPITHAASQYMQRIKRDGAIGKISDYFAHYDTPERVATLMKAAATVDGMTIEVRNYERHRKQLASTLCAWLGHPEIMLAEPAEGKINRSLSHGEYVMQRRLNRHLGGCASKFLSDPLCECLPQVEAQHLCPDHGTQQAMLTRLASAFEMVARYVEPTEQYDLSLMPPELPNSPFAMSKEQLELAIDMLGAEIASLRKTEHQAAQNSLSGRARQIFRALPQPMQRALRKILFI